ncbi:hypothetical protein GCM10010149_07070 [Nonomuraea roseoviolacea subsp. roseoviolacea]
MACFPRAQIDVIGELDFRVPHGGHAGKALLDLDHRVADLDVDAPPPAHLAFQVDLKIFFCEAEAACEQKLTDIGLDGGLAAGGLPV